MAELINLKALVRGSYAKKSGREWSLQLLLQIFVLYQGPWHTKSNSKTNKDCLIKHFASCLLSSVCSNAYTEPRTDPSWQPADCQHVCMLQTCISGNNSLACISIPKTSRKDKTNYLTMVRTLWLYRDSLIICSSNGCHSTSYLAHGKKTTGNTHTSIRAKQHSINISS